MRIKTYTTADHKVRERVQKYITSAQSLIYKLALYITPNMMRVATTITALTSAVSGMILPRQEVSDSSSSSVVTAAQYDGYVVKAHDACYIRV